MAAFIYLHLRLVRLIALHTRDLIRSAATAEPNELLDSTT